MSNRIEKNTGGKKQQKTTVLWMLLITVFTSSFAPVINATAPGDLIIPRKEGAGSEEFMPPSIFPHWVHRLRYRCDACHDSLFEMKLGATEISMELMSKRQSCGTCHNGEIAFDTGMQECELCHDIPEE